MLQSLWRWDDLIRATGGSPDGAPSRAIRGVSIDSRALQPGDLFVALRAGRDGHAFVDDAFKAGAAAALVAAEYATPKGGALLRVPDTLDGLAAIGRAARARSRARIHAVTGSAGKTGTKEALALCFGRVSRTHASAKSYNNHWGVPLTLARMPEGAAHGVFEIGMNHAGEIGPLSRMVRPHAAIITTVEPVHLAHFRSVEDIADAKAEIFEGLEPGSVAILNRDNEHFGGLAARARASGAEVMSFGQAPDADARLISATYESDRTRLEADIKGLRVSCEIGAPGRHVALNMLAVLAAVHLAKEDVRGAANALAELRAAPGRGARFTLTAPGGAILLIDESYNANPASMRAALAAMANVPRARFPRRIAVLGDMLELGPDAALLHGGLAPAVEHSGVDLVFACGPHMRNLLEHLPLSRHGAWAETSDGVREALLAVAAAGDVIMVKGSFGSRMAPLVEALKMRFADARADITA